MSVLGAEFEKLGHLKIKFVDSRFKFSYLYELDSLAVVNVRDLGGIKHAFKLLVFPDARLFQCANGDAKQVREGEHAGVEGRDANHGSGLGFHPKHNDLGPGLTNGN